MRGQQAIHGGIDEMLPRTQNGMDLLQGTLYGHINKESIVLYTSWCRASSCILPLCGLVVLYLSMFIDQRGDDCGLVVIKCNFAKGKKHHDA